MKVRIQTKERIKNNPKLEIKECNEGDYYIYHIELDDQWYGNYEVLGLVGSQTHELDHINDSFMFRKNRENYSCWMESIEEIFQ